MVAYLQNLGTRAAQREVSHGHRTRSSRSVDDGRSRSSLFVGIVRVGLERRGATRLRRRGARAVRAADDDRPRARAARRRMSDFTSDSGASTSSSLTLVSIVACGVLLLRDGPHARGQAHRRASTPDTTGHVWDEDLREYNNPLPRWWMWLFYITIVFALVYLVLYPGLGSFPACSAGRRPARTRGERSDVDDARRAALRQVSRRWTSEQVAADPEGAARWASGCSSTTARSATAPTPAARGASRTCATTTGCTAASPRRSSRRITNGRNGVMPPFGAALGRAGRRRTSSHYVRSLSGCRVDPLRAQLGKPLFAQNCAACHGADGKGNPAIGAPNLTDGIWLYGGSRGDDHRDHLPRAAARRQPACTRCPRTRTSLDDGKIQLLTAYVWGLSQPAAAK